MSEYYTLKQKAGLEALGDMQVDVVHGLLDYANQMINEMNEHIEKCDINSIAHASYRISQQIEYAKDVSHESMCIMPPRVTDKTRIEISDVETRFLKMLGQLDKKCNCSVK